MNRSKAIGVILDIGAIVAAALFLWGVAGRNYWAVAVPVAIGFIAIMALLFWIGWTMVSEAPVETAKEKPADPTPPQKP